MATIKGKVEIESDYGTHKYITFPKIGKQEIAYEVTIPDGADEKKFKAAFLSELKKEIDREKLSAKSIKDQLASWTAQFDSKKVPWADMQVLVEQINTSIKAREDFMVKKFEIAIEKKVMPAAFKTMNANIIREVKWKAIAKIVFYTVVALVAAAAAVAAVILTGGLALVVVVPGVIKGVSALKTGLGKAYEAYKTLGTTYKGLDAKMKLMNQTGVELGKLLETHRAQIDVEEKMLDQMKIMSRRLDGEYKTFSNIPDRPDLSKLGQQAKKARDELDAEIAANETALTKHKEVLASIDAAVDTTKLAEYMKRFEGSWQIVGQAAAALSKLSQAKDLLEPLQKMASAVA